MPHAALIFMRAASTVSNLRETASAPITMKPWLGLRKATARAISGSIIPVDILGEKPPGISSPISGVMSHSAKAAFIIVNSLYGC